MGGVGPHRHQRQARVPVGLLRVVGDEQGRRERDVVEDLRPLPPVRPQFEGFLGVALRRVRRGRLVVGEGAVRQGLHPVQVRLVEHLHPAGRRDVALVGDEEVLRLAEGAPHGLALAHRRLCPGLDGVEHRPGTRQGLVAGSGLGELHEVECVVGPAEVHHLTGRPGQGLPGARPVAALPRRVRGDDEVLLGRGFEADVVRHPAREDGQVGSDAPQAPLEMVGVPVAEHAAHFVELAHHRLALQAATAGRVPGPEHLDGALQFLDLLRPDGGGLIAVEPSGVGVQGVFETWGVGREGRIGVQPVMHGAAEYRSCGKRGTRAHQAASVEHEVHSREFGEDRSCPLGRPWHSVGVLHSPVVTPFPRAPVPDQTEVLDGHDTAESLGEQRRQHPWNRIARDLSHVDPTPHP